MSPNQIPPSSPFTVSFYIPVNTDSNTYYVQAIIYDALTGEILATENLTQQTTNTRLYSKRVQSPGDSSSLGRKIIVVATAYTDSGYTSKSPDYQDQAEVYLVKVQTTVVGGGGGGFGPDYVKIREIVKEEVAKGTKLVKDSVAKVPENIEFPEFPKMPFEAVFGAIGALQKSVNDIPKKETDLAPVLAGFESLKSEIEKIEEAMPELDLTPVLKEIQSLCEDIELNHQDSTGRIEEKKNEIIESVINIFEKSSSDRKKLEELRTLLGNPVVREIFNEPKKEPIKSFDVREII